MITLVSSESRERFLKAARGSPCFCTMLPAELELFGPESALMRFFTVNDAGALQLKGTSARLCGEYDPEETGIFLQMMGVSRVYTQGAVPDGYRPDANEKLLLMTLSPESGTALLQQTEFHPDTQPPPSAVTDFFCDAKENPEQWDNFYSELCTKCVHGAAGVWALRDENGILATAGVSAFYGNEAYLSMVRTRPSMRGKSIGSGLVKALCAELLSQNRKISLVCRKERAAFYERIGFQKCGGVFSCIPHEEV